MRRLLVHPLVRWLLPLFAVLLVLFSTQINNQHERGYLSSLAANFLPSTRSVSSNFVWEEVLLFYAAPDGTFDVATPYSDIGREQLSAGSIFATVTVEWRSRSRYGFVYTPLRREIIGSEIAWVKDFPHATPTKIEELENLLDHYRAVLWGHTISDEELQHIYQSGVFRSVFVRKNVPLLVQSRSLWSLDYTHLAGDLVFLANLFWWLLALRYTRRFWPKPDGSHCPSCGYELAGLPSPVCPECGKDLAKPGPDMSY